MVANSVQEIARELVKLHRNAFGDDPETVDALMSMVYYDHDHQLRDHCILGFGAHKSKGLWELPTDYRKWLMKQVADYAVTHSVDGCSVKRSESR